MNRSTKMPFMILRFLIIVLLVLVAQPHVKTLQAESAGTGLPVSETPYKYVEGERLVYRLSFDNASASDFRALFQGAEPTGTEGPAPPIIAFSFKTGVKGNLTATVIEKRESDVLLAFSMEGTAVKFAADGHNDPYKAEILSTGFGKTAYALVGLDGKIISLWHDPALETLPKTYLNGLLAYTQVVFPPGTTQYDKWETEEEDPGGRYIAQYRLLKPASKTAKKPETVSLKKKKIRYVHQPSKPGYSRTREIPTVIVPKGEMTARFNFLQGFLYSLDGRETQDILVSKKKVGLASSTIHVKYLRTENVDAARLVALKDEFATRAKEVKAASLATRPSPEEREQMLTEQQLGDATLESLLDELQKAEAVGDPKYDSTPLYLKFKALVYLHPESCRKLGEVLKSSSADSLAMKIIPAALSAVGNPQAQSALVTAIQSHRDDKRVLIQLLTSLAVVAQPTEEGEITIREIAFQSPDRDVRSTAQLALGAQARRLAAEAPERADKIVDMFLDEIKASKSPDSTRLILLALGNAGSARSLPVLTRYVTEGPTDLRATAVFSLRFINTPEAETLLVKALTSDEESYIRLTAANAFSFRKVTEEAFQAQKQALLKDQAVSVRLQVLSNLWSVEEAFPEVHKLVRTAATKDPSEDVRKAARDIMASYPKSYFK